MYDINLDINKGEILGIGVSRNGAVFTARNNLVFKNEFRSIIFKDQQLKINPVYSIKRGIYYVSSDRSEKCYLCVGV